MLDISMSAGTGPLITDPVCDRSSVASVHVWPAVGRVMLDISMSAGTGPLITDPVCDRPPVIDPASYRPERFR